jgi:hypothetical protein
MTVSMPRSLAQDCIDNLRLEAMVEALRDVYRRVLRGK